MSLDLQNESLLTFSEAGKHLPGRTHVSSIHRWRLRGVRGVKLETCLIGGIRYTSKEALQRFVDATTRVGDGEEASCKKSARRCQKQSKPACKTLDDAGITSSHK